MFAKAKVLKERYGKDIKTPFLQELLWFHRIKPDQDKELLTLEFLNVCSSHYSNGHLFDKEITTADYCKDLQLRNILYNFPELDDIVQSSDDENNKWKEIESQLNKKLEISFDYSYLKAHFQSVELFFISISLLRKASMGINTSRRWTSKFLFPFSFKTLFVDLDNRKSHSMDRRFFSRGGEVLYLMISRGKNAGLLKELIQTVYVNSSQNKRWNSLLAILRNNENTYLKNTNLGFLGADSHAIFDQLVDDLIALLSSDIPHNDIFEYFSSISAFYMVHYILTVAMQNTKISFLKNDMEKIVYPVELLAPRSDHVRRSSRQIYKINENLPQEALKKVFEQYMTTLADIKDKELLLKKLDTELNYKDEDEHFTEEFDLNKIKGKIWARITKKAKADLLPIHRILLKGTGLASVKKTNSYRYLANDDWLKTLVLINIDKRMPFHQFIDLLYERYGFIISNKHSVLLMESYSENDFKKNESRLFERLQALGLLESKSDGYAYVINQYGRKSL